MKPNTCIVLDVWEGQLDIDETILKSNGVAGIAIRINDMSGGHHMDTGFEKQWLEAKNFVRFPYFVYNPWVDGLANFDWLVAHMPKDAKSVAIDIEVKYPNYPANKYAGEVIKFLELCKLKWKTIIYTAEWFLPYLSSWPKVDYWWAQYPDPDTYFKGITTWDGLKVALDRLDKPFNVAKVPGTLKMWQFTGDYLTLPGSTRKMDVNIFYGTETELADYFGASSSVVIPPVITPTLSSYIVKDDLWAKRLYVRPKYPATVRLNGGKAAVKLPAPWMAYAYEINKHCSNYQFETPTKFKPAIGWHNVGDDTRVEQLTMADNVVDVYKIVDNKAYIKTWDISKSPPSLPIKSGDLLRHPQVHMFTTQFSDHLDQSTNGRWPQIIAVSNPGEELWLDVKDIHPFVQTKFIITIKAIWSNIRAWPNISAKVMKRQLFSTKLVVAGYVTIDNDIWGRVPQGWIALKYNGQWMTDWKL